MNSRIKMSKLYTSRTQEQEATRRRPAHKSPDMSFANDPEAGFESESASPALYVFPALKIGRVDSPEERTADEVAHRVVGGGVVGPKGVERVRDGGLPVSPAIANRIQARSGQGEKLPEAERAFFEPRFGRGFGDVTIHRDGEAASLARSLNAKAFTVGSDIYFGSGQYSPSEDGRRLMAHELTHTVQQGAGVQREVESEPDKKFSWKEKLSRLMETAKNSYRYAPEILSDAWVYVKEHWLAFTLTALGVLAAEGAVMVLGAAPTGISQIVSVLLQSILLAFFVSAAAVETKSSIEEGMAWYELSTNSGSNPEELADASRAFCRMLGHLILIVLALAGIRRGVNRLGKTVQKGPGRTGAELAPGGRQNKQPALEPKKYSKPEFRPPKFDVRKMTEADLRKFSVKEIVSENPPFANNQNVVSARLILNYAKLLLKGKTPEPVEIHPPVEGTQWVIGDGHHRFLAAILVGVPIKTVKKPGALVPYFWERVTWTLK